MSLRDFIRMRPSIRPAEVESWGVPPGPAKELAARIDEASRQYPEPLDPRSQERFWLNLRRLLLTNPAARWRLAAHLALYRFAYDVRRPEDGPGPAWVPSKADMQSSNIGKMMGERRLTSFEDFRRWSVDRREDYWSTMVRTLGIVFRTRPTRILKEPADPRHPEWLAGAQLNIAESCFNAAPNKTAILFGLEGSNAIRKMTYGQLHKLSSRIANGLDALGLRRGERIALYLPMTPEAVAAYLGIVLSGRCVVGIADAAAPPEFQKRARIADAHAVFTVDSYLRDGKVHDIYSKKSAADAYLHQDVRPSDVLAWPTSFGWMMGPWLTYASLVNQATMALYVGATTTRAFGEFLARSRVTMLGVVPKLVRSWKTDRAMEGLDWHRIRVFSSTAEPSTPDEMLYLMFLAGYRPIVEYCGGTEIGGGYITGTVVQPCAPSMFTTSALGLDLEILDGGRPAARGEVFLVPPGGGYYRHLGRIDDMININGVKTSSEEIRSVLKNEQVYDSKPIAVDVDRSGQHRLVVYAVPRDPGLLGSEEFRAQLRRDFQQAIKANLNPLLAHIEDVVLVSELPQTGPGKTRTMKELRSDYAARTARA